MSDQTPRRGENTRAAIVEAAHELFVQQGYHGTSMRQIARQADVALGGLYNHFASKEEVFQAVFLEFHPYQKVIPAILQARDETIEQFSQEAIRRMISALEDRPDFLNLLFIEVVEFKSQHARQLFSSLMPQIAQVVQGVMAANSDRLRSIPPLMLMRFYFGMFFSYFLTEIIFASQAPPEFRDGAVDHFVDIFLNGVLRRDQDASGELLAP